MSPSEAIDQLPVTMKHWIVGFFPPGLQPIVSVLLSILPIIIVFPSLFALTTILERKGLGRIQNRLGPNRVGPFGFLQPLADGLKSLTKEDLVPRAADKVLFFLAPLALLLPVMLVYSVLPIGRNMVAIDLDGGVLFFFAVGASTELAIFMAGWASHNKYSMLGAMRAIAQMISYEIPLILAVVPVIMITGTLSTVKIVEAQQHFTGWFPHWFVFTPWGFAGFILFLIAATAESNRSPFDIPEGESEIIAGYFVEYSGFKFALFFLAEYLGLFAVSGMAITLFLGGWGAPLPMLYWMPSYAWFFAKLVSFILLFIWVRGTLPRLRMDQLMNFAWKFMFPMTLINIVSAAAWHFMGLGIGRWIVSALVVGVPYVLLGRALSPPGAVTKRTYEFAT
jgi:NADH-quinone oxidoreductase subunit H